MRWITALLALCCAVAATQAHADCRGKLADVNRQLDAANLGGIELQQFTMLRDQAATLCNQGQEPLAMQFLVGLEQELARYPGAKGKQQSQASSSGPPITYDYLAGTWCAMVTQEQSEITFTRDGTYSACFHDSMAGRFGHCTRPGKTEQWLGNYKEARIIGDNEFALGASDRSTTYRRGNCSEHGI